MAREDAERRARFEAEARAIAERSAKEEATAREHAEREAKESALARSRLLTVSIMVVLIAASIVTWLMYSVSKHKANEAKLALRVQQQDEETARKLKEQAQQEEKRLNDLQQELKILLAAGDAKAKDVEALQKQIKDVQAKSEANSQAAASPNARSALSDALDRAVKAEDRAARAEKERDQLAATLKGESSNASELEAARTRAVKAEQERDQLRTELDTVKKQLKEAQDAINALGLGAVLKSMDKSAETTTTVQANFFGSGGGLVFFTYREATGTLYLRRRGRKIDCALVYTDPLKLRILFADGKVTYAGIFPAGVKPPTDVYSPDQERIETLLGAGFTTPTADLLKYVKVKFVGMEKVGDLLTAKLQLTSDNLNVSSPKISGSTLWIDPVRGVAVKAEIPLLQNLSAVTSYSQIVLNRDLPPANFELPPKSH